MLLLSLIGFFVTGWFLSRAFVLTLFLLGGMVEVVYEMALRNGMVGPRPPLGRTMFHSLSIGSGADICHVHHAAHGQHDTLTLH